MKFKAHGIYRNQVKTIKSFLDQRFLWVSIKEASQSISKQDRACSRVPCLNPTLFNIYIDDIIFEVESIPEVSTLLFADNFAIQGTSSNIEALEACLNCALSRVEKWASTNDMVINKVKTGHQLFSLSLRFCDVYLIFMRQQLMRINEVVYLDVKLDNKIKWLKHFDNQANKESQRLSLLKRLVIAVSRL